MGKEISVILVNYNGREYNDRCIESLLRSTVSACIQIVVVDNASTDGSLEALRARWDEEDRIHVISLDQNYGFSKANNEGIRWSLEQGIDRFLLLNNDTEIAPEAIERMLAYQRDRGGIVVPKVLYADGTDTIWCAGGDFTPIVKKAVQRGLNQKDRGQFDKSGVCGFANGCAMLLSKEITEKIGFLDERFFLYYEDTEYSMRAAEHGVPILYCADAVVRHKVNGSTKGNEKPANAYYITRNWLLCNRLHMHSEGRISVRFLVFAVYFICNRLAWMLIWLARGKGAMCIGAFRGIRDFYNGTWGKYAEP